ncbi:MAG: tRNA lysidine(34) synthetase TilS [Armatimonadetes bacterium]|nr:tRNA lysidine(34) synthetase TilS [Armatimonadota bacterium]
MNERHRLIESLLATVRQYTMLLPGEKVLVAVSGGPDSVALLHALWTVRDELSISLHVAHLNHSFRGEESDKDEEYVRSLAANLLIPCSVEKVDVPKIQKTLRISAEQAARLVRYEFLENTAEKIGASRIALGHTADDQVETVLMNIIRGTGVDGLVGMPPVRGKIIRPLISVRRKDVNAYIQEAGLQPRIDETNLLPIYTRNRIRLQLLPTLRVFNPDIDTAILQLAELARADSAYLDEKAKEAFIQNTKSRDGKSVHLDLSVFEVEPLAIRRRVIREAYKAIKGEITDLGYKHVEELLRLIATVGGFRYELPGGIFVEKSGRLISFYSERPPDQPIIYKYELAVPGKTVITEADLIIEAEIITEKIEPLRPRGSMEVVLDYDAIRGSLIARNWKPGDRIQPLGMVGSKKLQDLFTDEKIPRQMRYRTPVIEDSEKIVWVVGLAVSELAKVTSSTRTFLRLTANPLRT